MLHACHPHYSHCMLPVCAYKLCLILKSSDASCFILDEKAAHMLNEKATYTKQAESGHGCTNQSLQQDLAYSRF